MPKEVNLPPRKTPIDKDALLAKVTAGKQVAPAARAAVQTRGQLPLPTGRPSGKEYLTPMELETLRKEAGWKEGDPIPSNMAEILAEIREEKRIETDEVNLPLPVPPGHEPIKVETINDTDPDPEKRALVQKKMQEAMTIQRQMQVDAARDARTPPSVKQAIAQASRQGPPVDVVDDVTPQKKPQKIAAIKPSVIEDQAKIAAEAAAKETPPPMSDTGATAPMSHCPHCRWDLAMPDIAEPDDEEKLAFLASILGEKPFNKEYKLFGGQVLATFRQLTPREIEAIYHQVFLEAEAGTIKTDMDHFEKVNRYRMMLQLQRLRSAADKGFDHDLPDGLSPETNPRAVAFYDKNPRPTKIMAIDGEDREVPDMSYTPLPQVEEFLLSEVLKTEAILRVIGNTCNQFNRLVAKMEAMANNSDFISGAAPQP